jgi:ABC-type amino acid transport substrate-binding protein
MRLDRRWWPAIGIAVIAVVAVAVSYFYFGGPSSEQCRPVKDLLDFNRSESQKIASKGGDDQGIPTVAEDAAYQQWADGLAERARKVSSPDLAQTATAVAKQADAFVGDLAVLRAQTAARAPGAPAPPVAYELSLLNAQITDGLTKLTKACS